jgi:hypothetical protein
VRNTTPIRRPMALTFSSVILAFLKVALFSELLVRSSLNASLARFTAKERYFLWTPQFFSCFGAMRFDHQFGPNCPGKFPKPPRFCVKAGASEFRLSWAAW